jgi:hypothetical protein
LTILLILKCNNLFPFNFLIFSYLLQFKFCKIFILFMWDAIFVTDPPFDIFLSSFAANESWQRCFQVCCPAGRWDLNPYYRMYGFCPNNWSELYLNHKIFKIMCISCANCNTIMTFGCLLLTIKMNYKTGEKFYLP